MKYEPHRHITHSDLSIMAGMSSSSLVQAVLSGSAPERLGTAKGGQHHRSPLYDRAAAMVWLESIKPARSFVPPRTPAPFRPLNLSDGLRDNFARAGELYPHSLRSQGRCIGNGAERQHGFWRGR